MKNGLILALLLIFTSSLSAQLVAKTRYERLMESSHRRQTAGFIFLGGGAGMTAAGLYLYADGTRKNRNEVSTASGLTGLSTGETEQVLGVVLTGLGVGSMCTSIPFFIGAHQKRKKALSLSLKTESAASLYKLNLYNQLYPALAMKISLGK